MIRFTFACAALLLAPVFTQAGSLPDGPYVSTSASATEEVDPDYAVIDLQFRVVESSSDEARAATNRAQQRLVELLGPFEDALRDTRQESLQFGREYEYDQQQRKRVEAGFFGQFSFRIEVSDFDRLSKLHYALAAGEWNRLGEPGFEVADTDAAHEAARRKALARATDQARALAEAQGSRLGDPWGIIFEPMHELAGRSPGVAGSRMQRSSLGVGSADAEFAIPTTPRPVEFEARVGVVYRLEPGAE